MFYKKMLILFVLLTVEQVGRAETSICFQSEEASGKIIDLLFVIKSDSSATVKYKGQNEAIWLNKTSETVASSSKENPVTVKSKWNEINKGNVSGKYTLTSTGAIVGELLYVRGKDKKQFKFFDSQQNPELNCGW